MKLFHALDSMADEAWEWGTFDCLHFTARVLLETTGVDYRQRMPTYTSMVEAAQHMESLGDVEAIITSCLGDPKPALQAMRGDVVLVDVGDDVAAGICTGQSAALAAKTGGVAYIPMRKATMAWSVQWQV